MSWTTVLVQIATILLWITTAVQTTPFQCPRELPAVFSSQSIPAVVYKVLEGESAEFTCVRTCHSTAQWSIRIPKYSKAIYIPERKRSSSQLPKDVTATMRDDNKCVKCLGIEVKFSTLELNNIHVDLNGSKIYCGQQNSVGKTFVENPIILLVYHLDTEYDKQFPMPSSVHKYMKKAKPLRKNTWSGYIYADRLFNELRSGNVKLQVSAYLMWLAINIVFSVLIITTYFLDYQQIGPTGVRFFGKVYKTTIRHHQKTVIWPDIGLKLQIPRGTVPMGIKSILRCRQSISGPYIAPPGQTFASIFYHITVSHRLCKRIGLTIPHAARLHNQNDCSSMQFLRASDKPVYNERGDIEYRFTEVNDGTFTVQSKEAKINLKEFSFWCCSTSESKNLDYLVKFVCPREPLLPTPHSIFAVSLATPTLDKFFHDLLEREYPEEYFKSTDGRQVNFKHDSDYAELQMPQNITDQKYTISVKSGTEKITKKMADLPARNEDYKQVYSPMYPPRAVLEFSADDQSPPSKPLECNFKVTVNTNESIDGMSFPLSFPNIPPLKTSGAARCVANGVSIADHSSPTNIFETKPTMKHLQLIKWCDKDGQARELKIIERGSNKWTEIGDQFEIDKSILTECEDRWRYNSARFRYVLQKWLEKSGTPSYECTWNGLIEVLRDVKHGSLANDLATALTNGNSIKC